MLRQLHYIGRAIYSVQWCCSEDRLVPCREPGDSSACGVCGNGDGVAGDGVMAARDIVSLGGRSTGGDSGVRGLASVRHFISPAASQHCGCSTALSLGRDELWWQVHNNGQEPPPHCSMSRVTGRKIGWGEISPSLSTLRNGWQSGGSL